MSKSLLLIGFIAMMVYNAEAASYCWNPLIGTPTYTGASTGDISTPAPAATFCTYTHAYGPSGAYTNTMWPTYTYAASTAPATPTASSTLTYSALAGATATVTNLPSVTSCYVGSTLTASTLTTQAQTACASTSYFCQATFTGVSGSTATGFTSGCQATQCTPSTTVLCSMVANTNQVFGCYVGAFITLGTSTWTRTICAPTGSAQPYASAAYCKNVYSWTTTNWLTITGSCETSCTAVPLSLTGTTSTTGTVCSGTIYGNSLISGSDSSININMIAMVLSSIMGLFFIHY